MVYLLVLYVLTFYDIPVGTVDRDIIFIVVLVVVDML
jgi:hypothetical protein